MKCFETPLIFDGGRHADDRSGADGACKRRDQGSELTDVSFGPIVVGHRHLDGERKLALDETGADGHEQMRSKKQNDHRRAPHGCID